MRAVTLIRVWTAFASSWHRLAQGAGRELAEEAAQSRHGRTGVNVTSWSVSVSGHAHTVAEYTVVCNHFLNAVQL